MRKRGGGLWKGRKREIRKVRLCERIGRHFFPSQNIKRKMVGRIWYSYDFNYGNYNIIIAVMHLSTYIYALKQTVFNLPMEGENHLTAVWLSAHYKSREPCKYTTSADEEPGLSRWRTCIRFGTDILFGSLPVLVPPLAV